MSTDHELLDPDMLDRELLELAAKAAGIAILRSRLDNPICADMLLVERTDDGHAIGWNPLTDDGDALRLAAKLRLNIHYGHAGEGPIHCGQYSADGVEEWGTDAPENTRRAIVRAAAAIGEAMP